jgi:hypothetical protein
MLAKQCCTTLAIPLVHFSLVVLEMGSHEVFAPAGLNCNPPYLSLPGS